MLFCLSHGCISFYAVNKSILSVHVHADCLFLDSFHFIGVIGCDDDGCSRFLRKHILYALS